MAALSGASDAVPIMYILKPHQKNFTLPFPLATGIISVVCQVTGTTQMRSSRANHLAASGHGKHYTSPQKPRDKRKTTTRVVIQGQQAKHQRLLTQLKALKARHHRETDDDVNIEPAQSDYIPDDDGDHPILTTAHGHSEEPTFKFPEPASEDNQPTDKVHRRIHPDTTAHRLYQSWQAILPSLLHPLLSYITHSNASIHPAVTHIEDTCDQMACGTKSTSIVCLQFEFFVSLPVTTCSCRTVPQALVTNGFFPTAPSQPRMAVSIHLLDFYRSLFERSCEAVNALSAALHSFYTERGFDVLDRTGALVRDPFRRGLGYAIQWYDSLRIIAEKEVDSVVQQCCERLKTDTVHPIGHISPPLDLPVVLESAQASGTPVLVSPPINLSSTPRSAPEQCSRILQQRCPACFGGETFGRPFDRGSDIHVATDGNLHHRHRTASGDSPAFYEPAYFLPKDQVDAIGDRLEQARKKPAKRYKPKVPDEAVDECESAHTATNGSQHKASEHFDDNGVMALVCRHDIPLFFANIDTPGEQQKYAVALFEHLFTLLPTQATVTGLYDVGCVLDRSSHLYDIFSDNVAGRLMLVTNAMHAYGHQWACQLVYNPRLQLGMGLTDGEGVERLWSRLRKLIGITRSSGRSRRIWLLDRQAKAIGHELRDDLGDWIQRRLRLGVKAQGDKAQAILDDCGVSLPDLRQEWHLQQASQLSARTHAPIRLKKELDLVLNLQSDLDTLDKTINAAQKAIGQGSTKSLLESLEKTHDRLKKKVDGLYGSLNVHRIFPELQGIDFEFLQALLMARDLKINIRKRAIGSFFEWDKLDQAAGGREAALGTKLHQHTRKAIARRRPALITAIRKFNHYCATMESLYKSEWAIPLPKPLPTELAELRACTHLMEDVWVSPATGGIPRWLDDPDVREGIRAMLKVDRAQEERDRLHREAENLCRWTRNELAALELALRVQPFQHLVTLLQRQHKRLLHLLTRWPNHHEILALHVGPIQPPTLAPLNLGRSSLQQPSTAMGAIPLIDFELDPLLDETPPILDSDQLVIADLLSIEHEESEYDEAVALFNVKMEWRLPRDLQTDSGMLSDFQTTTHFQLKTLHINMRRILHRLNNLPTHIFEQRDLEIAPLTSTVRMRYTT